MADPSSDPRPPSTDSDGGRDLYRLIANASLDAVVSIDQDGRIVDWNGRAEDIFGWRAAEVLGTPMADFLIPERYRARHHEGMARFLGTGEGPILRRRIEMFGLRKDGSEIPIELSISPARKDEGWLFVAFLRDLTEQHKTTQRLQVQNAVLRVLTGTPSLEELEKRVLEAVCMVEPWHFGAYWRREGDVLVCSSIYERPGTVSGSVREKTLGSRFRKGQGFPGWIWAEGGSRALLNYEKLGFPRSADAFKDDLHTAYGFPVMLGGSVRGVFEFYGSRAPWLNTAMMEAITAIADQIGLYVERKITEEALRESEERFRVLADNAPVLIWISEASGKVVYVNRPWEEYTGRPSRTVASRNWGDAIHPDDFRAMSGYIYGEDEAHKPFRMEFRLKDRRGEYRWFMVHGLPRRMPGGEYAGYIGACVDIDETKRAREEIADRERRFRALIENSTDAISITGGNGTIYYVSASAEKLIGYTDTELEGMNAYSLVHPDDMPGLRKTIDLLLTRPRGREKGELRLKHKDGSWRWFAATIANLIDDPLIGGMLTNYRDVTEIKRADQERDLAEQHLRQAQKMEAVGRLAGGIAHDFNNLLTSINGYSAMALEALNPQGQLKEFLEEILKSGERAAALTRQLLAYSRKQTLAPRLWDLNEIVLGMEGMLRRVIGEDIEMMVKPFPEPCMSKVDRGQIEQILLNLVLNARDAMPEGGKLLLETANVDLDDEYASTHIDSKPGPYAMLAVSDTGTGITDEVKRNLFEPFFTTKEAGKGTGLGLSSVYGIVKQSGGAVSVYSEVGMGSTFRVYLPRSLRQGEAMPEPGRTAAEGNPRGRETVLLVEDEESVRRFSVQALESLGYRVLTASNGREALAVLEGGDKPVQLIITDVIMPDMGGNALADRVRIACPGLPVIFISGYTEVSVAHRGLITEGDTFLQKPFTLAELAKRVRAAMDAHPVQGVMRK
jgi:PAS domain S-box-containing protein